MKLDLEVKKKWEVLHDDCSSRPCSVCSIQANNDRTNMNSADPHTAQEIKATLLAMFGPFMSAKEVVSALKLNSVDALRMARKRGTLKLTPLPVHGRRSLLFATDQVAHVAHGLIQGVDSKKEPLM